MERITLKNTMNNNPLQSSSSIIDESLRKITKGAGIVFIGTIIGMLLNFLQRVVIARFYTPEEYGIFSLAVVIISIFSVISALGLQLGSARQISFYRGKKNTKNVNKIIFFTISIGLVSSITLASILYFSSELISLDFFHDANLTNILKIFSICLPFLVMISIFSSIFRGFEEAKPKLFFENILRSGTFLLLMIPIIIMNLMFTISMFAYIFSFIITCILFAIFLIKKISIKIIRKDFKDYALLKELLLFSMPLLIASVFFSIITWTDTIMIGFFKDSNVVGLYNGAAPLAQIITIALLSTAFIYVPVIAKLYSQDKIEDIKRTYQLTTKWIFSASIPIFLLLFLFPETVLNFIFGANFGQAALALRILSMGIIFNGFLGLNGETLISIGNSKFLMYANIFAGISNIFLNYFLIPIYGIEGAAFSTAISFALANIIVSIKLYDSSKVHFLTKNYIKNFVVSIGLIFFIYTLTLNFKIHFWAIPIIFVFFILSYLIILLIIKAFDEEDIKLLLAIEKRIGINLRIIKRILSKFV